MTVAAPARRDIELRKCNDQLREGNGGVLLARMRGVLEAQDAVAAHELGAKLALRDALVSLAATCELLASDLPTPRPGD